jgi:restriction endonuclease S subunit
LNNITGQQRVPVSFLEHYLIPILPLEIQHKIIGILDNYAKTVNLIKSKVGTMIHSNGKIKQDLDKLQSLILDQAFSGKLLDQLNSQGKIDNYL